MPLDNIAWLLVAAGVLLLIAGVIGGGFQFKDITIPTLQPKSRTMAVIVGALLVGVGAVSRMDPRVLERVPGPGEEPVAVPQLTGLSREAAEDTLRRLQLVGQVQEGRAWVPAGEVIRQEPSAGERVVPGTRIDFAVAGAPYVFSSRRTLATTQGDNVVGEAVYSIRLIRSPQGDTVAEFALERAEVRPAEDFDRSNLLGRLVGRPGHVPLSALQTFDVSRDWQPLARLVGDIEQTMSEATISEEPDLSALAPGISMALIAGQMNFDIRAILTTVPPSIGDGNAVELQSGTALMSSIRLGGAGRPTQIGIDPHRAFDIVRRAPDQGVQTVGTATYRRDIGLLTAFDMRYVIPEIGAYRLVLQQR